MLRAQSSIISNIPIRSNYRSPLLLFGPISVQFFSAQLACSQAHCRICPFRPTKIYYYRTSTSLSSPVSMLSSSPSHFSIISHFSLAFLGRVAPFQLEISVEFAPSLVYIAPSRNPA